MKLEFALQNSLVLICWYKLIFRNTLLQSLHGPHSTLWAFISSCRRKGRDIVRVLEKISRRVNQSCKDKTHKPLSPSGSGVQAEMLRKKTDIKTPRTPRGIRVSFPSRALHDSIQVGRDNAAGDAEPKYRGACTKCGRGVYTDQDRGKEMNSGLYYHARCDPAAHDHGTATRKDTVTPRAGLQISKWAEPLCKRCGFACVMVSTCMILHSIRERVASVCLCATVCVCVRVRLCATVCSYVCEIV